MSINLPNVTEICYKCCRTFHEHLGLVSPIDSKGNNLERVLLCRDCMEDWNRLYKRFPDGKPIDEFYAHWDKSWRGFMKGRVVPMEKVEFT